MRMWCSRCDKWVESDAHQSDHVQYLQSGHIPQKPPGLEVPVWRKNPPTVPGLYWFQLRTETDFPEGVTRHCRVVMFHGNLVDQNQGVGVEGLQRWWAGPLLEPEE